MAQKRATEADRKKAAQKNKPANGGKGRSDVEADDGGDWGAEFSGWDDLTDEFERNDGWVHPTEENTPLTVVGKLIRRVKMETSLGEGAFFQIEATKGGYHVFDDEGNEIEVTPGMVVAVLERASTKILSTLAKGTPVAVRYIEKVELDDGKRTWWKTKVKANTKAVKGNDIPF